MIELVYFHSAIAGIFFLIMVISLLCYVVCFNDHIKRLLPTFVLAPITFLYIPTVDYSHLPITRLACFIWLGVSISFAAYYLWQRHVSKALKVEPCQIMATLVSFIGLTAIIITVVECQIVIA